MRCEESDGSHWITDNMARVVSDVTHRLHHIPLYQHQNFICNLHTESSPPSVPFRGPVKIRRECHSFPAFTLEPTIPPLKYFTYQPSPSTLPSLQASPILPHTQRDSFIPIPHRLVLFSLANSGPRPAPCPTVENAKAIRERLRFRRVLAICLDMGRRLRAFSWMTRDGLMLLMW